MKNPQTLAEKLYVYFPSLQLKSIKDYACCAFTLMWCLKLDPDDATAIMAVADMIEHRALDVDCTVYWAKAAEYLTGQKLTVEFKDIKDAKEIKQFKERTPVKYSYNGKSHWVGVENGKVKFNALERSLCVEKGKPVTARILHITGGNK